MRLGPCCPPIRRSIGEILLLIACVGCQCCLGEVYLGIPWLIEFWSRIESVCAYMGSVSFFWTQGEIF